MRTRSGSWDQGLKRPDFSRGLAPDGATFAKDSANRTNFGGVYGHTLTVSEPGSNNLGIITAADPTGLLVATPAEGDPNFLSVREYKGY